MARLRIELQDRPGALFGVVKLFDRTTSTSSRSPTSAIFTTLPAKGAEIDIECEARDAAQLERLIDALHADGYKVHPVAID